MLLFALPVFLGNVFQQFYNTFDSWCVAEFIGDEAMVAVSSSGSLIFMMVSFFNGVAMGAGIGEAAGAAAAIAVKEKTSLDAVCPAKIREIIGF